jgi:hypothetical protein
MESLPSFNLDVGEDSTLRCLDDFGPAARGDQAQQIEVLRGKQVAERPLGSIAAAVADHHLDVLDRAGAGLIRTAHDVPDDQQPGA